MKHLFSVDRTEDRTHDEFDSTPYVAARVSDEVREKLNAAFSEEVVNPTPAETEESTAAKRKIRESWWLCVGCAAGAIATYFALEELGLMESASASLILPIALLGASMVFNVRARKLERARLSAARPDTSTDIKAAVERFEAASREAARELGIPDDAKALDVLPFYYRMKNGTPARLGKRNRYENLGVSAYRMGERLCLATAQERLEIPISDIQGYRLYDREYTVDMWLKEQASDSEAYAKYNIRKSGFLGRRARTLCGVSIRHESGEEYELLVPAYDLPILQALVPMREIKTADE